MPNNNFMSAPDAMEVLTPYAASIKNLKITALKETSPATSAHEVGTYLTYNNVIYSVKSAIAVGDTLTVDTNIEVADIPEGAVVYWEDDSSPSGQVQSDWNQTDNTQPDYIKNKPSDDVVTLNGNSLSFTTDSEQAARECVITLEPLQAGSGDPSPSNVRAISGYDKVELTGCGKNLAQIESGNYNSNGSRHANSKRARTVNKYLLKAGTYYYSCTSSISGKSIDSAYMYWANGFDINNEITYNSEWVGSNYNSFTINEDTYVSLLFRYIDESDISINDLKCQLELGSTPTEYEPYNPITDYSEPLPETVYGGTLNVETGELVVDRAGVDMGSLNWTKLVETNRSSYSAVPTNIKLTIRDTKLYCSIYKPLCNKEPYNEGWTDVIYTTNDYLVAKGVAESTVETFKAAVTGQKLVYELATPYTIHLTPAQVRLLQGNNVVTTNGTSIKLTYRNGEVASLADVSSVAESVNALGEKVSNITEKGGAIHTIPFTTESNITWNSTDQPIKRQGSIIIFNANFTVNTTGNTVKICTFNNDNVYFAYLMAYDLDANVVKRGSANNNEVYLNNITTSGHKHLIIATLIKK